MIALAVMLFAAALAGWLAVTGAAGEARAYSRFACVLYAALASASMAGPQVALSVTLIISAVAPVLLALSLRFSFRGAVAVRLVATILAAVSVAGIAAAATGIAILAFAPLLFSVIAMIAMSLRGFSDGRGRAMQTIAGACALLAGASAFAAGGVGAEPALLLFSAAGLLGLCLALAPRSGVAVEQEGPSDLRAVAIRKTR
jgi:hypothetical protein